MLHILVTSHKYNFHICAELDLRDFSAIKGVSKIVYHLSLVLIHWVFWGFPWSRDPNNLVQQVLIFFHDSERALSTPEDIGVFVKDGKAEIQR